MYKENVIATRFSKSAKFYEKFAQVQKYAATRLFEKIASEHIDSSSSILEIGCGTGLLSVQLARLFKNNAIHFLDPASGMLEICRNNLSALGSRDDVLHHKFIDKAIEDYIDDYNFEQNKYSLIVSSFALHWVQSLPQVLKRLLLNLEKGGKIIFCCPGAKSFPEWRDICSRESLPFTANKLPSREDLDIAKEMSARIDWREYSYTTSFSNPLNFFREMKALGADVSILDDGDLNFNQMQLSVSQFRKLLRSWQALSENASNTNTQERKVDCTYWMIEGIISQ